MGRRGIGYDVRVSEVRSAVTEGLNAKDQWIKYSAFGYRNGDAFKMAIYFHWSGVDLESRLPLPLLSQNREKPFVDSTGDSDAI